MTSISYYGNTEQQPIFIKENYLDFREQTLLQGYVEGTQQQIEDYQEFIRIIFSYQNNLIFKSIQCSQSTIFISDTKNELWGKNNYGQLGIGALTDYKQIPICLSRVYLKHRFQCVANSDNEAIGYNLDGKLYSWGKTKHWRLGISTKEKCLVKPTKIAFENFYKSYSEQAHDIKLNITRFKDNLKINNVVMKNGSTFILTDQFVYCYGKDNKGRLGKGPKLTQIMVPQVIVFPSNSVKIIGLSAAETHCLAWDFYGALYSWGDNYWGKLGHPPVKQTYRYIQQFPKKIQPFASITIIQAAAGSCHSLALSSKGQIFTFGKSNYKEEDKKILKDHEFNITEFNNGVSIYESNDREDSLDMQEVRPRPLNNSHEHFFVKISAGPFQSAAIDCKGFLFIWGRNTNNCLGKQSQVISYPTLMKNHKVTHQIKHIVLDVAFGEGFMVTINQSTISNIENIQTQSKKSLQKIKLFVDHAKKNLQETKYETKSHYQINELRKNQIRQFGKNKKVKELRRIR